MSSPKTILITATRSGAAKTVIINRGPAGEDGDGSGGVGPPGEDGASAYEVAVENGFVGTEAEWASGSGWG